MPVLKFDSDKIAVINPPDFVKKIDNMPETIVSFFERRVMEYFLNNFSYEIIGQIGDTSGPYNIYKINYMGKELAVTQANIGAPFCVGCFEEIIALGVKNILLFGSCGSLVDLNENSIIIPYAAMRDEGTSYHYAEASEEIELDKDLVNKLAAFFESKDIHYSIGKTWTTDGFYRETKSMVAEMKSKGCLSVEMECAAMTAMCAFRNVKFSQFFYTADSLVKESYNIGSMKNQKLTGQQQALLLALECATTLFD